MQFHVVCLTPNSQNADIIDYKISLCFPFCLLVYIDMGTGSSGTAQLSFEFANTFSDRGFEIKATQIKCNDRNRFEFMFLIDFQYA